MFGFSAEEMIGSPVFRLVPDDRVDEESSILRRLRRGERIDHFETQRLTRSGHVLDISATFSPIRSGGGEVVGVSTIARDITARVRTEAALGRLAAIVESSEDAIIGKTLDGVITSWNGAAEQIFGYPATDAISRSIAIILPVDRLQEEGRLRATIADGRRVPSFETQRRRQDGVLIDVSVACSPIRDRQDRIVGVSSIVRDISETKRRELARRNAERSYRTLFEQAPVGLAVVDRSGRIVEANDHLCGILGYAPFALEGRYFGDFVAESAPGQGERVIETLAGGGDTDTQWRLRRRDGAIIDVEAAATTMPDARTLTIVRDVTERHRSAEALRVAEERMRFALEAAGVGIWDFDFATNALTCSPILEQHCGVEPGAFGGSFDAFLERVHPDDRQSLLDARRQAFETGADFAVTHRVIRPDGAVRWLRGVGRVLLDGGGAAVRSVGITLDITEQRALEEQFHHAQKMEALGRLAGGVAHDFNNLLTAILGHCELLLNALGPSDARRGDVAEIQLAGTRAASLTRQLLGFSRREVTQPVPIKLQCDRHRDASDAEAAAGRGRDSERAPAGRSRCRHHRPEPGRTDHHEPGRQRPRRDADRWAPDD